MWIHPKDKVEMGNKNLVVKHVEGLYSCGGVRVVLQDTQTNQEHTYPLQVFNEMNHNGEIKVIPASERPRTY